MPSAGDMPVRSLHIICSDAARNGKSLIARLLADLMIMQGRDLLLLDCTGPQPTTAIHFPTETQHLDLDRTTSMVSLFDTMLYSGRNHVVDLSAKHLDAFFNVVEDAGFLKEALNRNIDFNCYYIIDRSVNSFRTARAIWHTCDANFTPVRNLWAGSFANEKQVELTYQEMSEQGELVLPVISVMLFRWLAVPGNEFRTADDTPQRGQIRPPTDVFSLSSLMAKQFSTLGKI